ncbi:MAG: DUF3604 domain-containing protein [Promethearchaeota archaeon]|nr:MAG: DUF3604 domain-containing protein [Candidatus Lokiarchaeota archaeon]
MEEKKSILLDIHVSPEKVKVREYCSISVSFILKVNFPKQSLLIFRIRGGRNNKNDWYFLQPYDADEKGYAELNFNNDKKILPLTITGKDLLIKYLILDEMGLEKDTKINFSIDNTLSQSIIEENKKIEILYKIPGKSEILCEECPKLTIISGSVDHLNIITPSIVNSSEDFKCILRFEDIYNNLADNSFGKISLYFIDQENEEFIKNIEVKPSDEGFIELTDLKIEKEGIYSIEAKYNHQSYRSNPFLCKSNQGDELKLFWGYIHGHTSKSDGMISIDDYFENLIKSGLDFGTSTEHDRLYETSDTDFGEIKEIVEKYNARKDFVSLFGYEYGTWYTGYGDICIYHLTNNIPIFRSEINKYNSTPKLIKNLKKYKNQVLMVGHHTALRPGYRNWDYFDNSLEKLVEIYSTWGNQEYPYSEGNPLPPRYKFFGYGKYARKRGPILGKRGSYVRDALEKGYKLGFIAGGDDHFGAFPSGKMDLDNGIYPSGIMAIWAKSLKKEELWRALNARRCYGTTGARVIIEFWIDGRFMGQIFDLNENESLKEERNLKLKVISPIKIERIEIIRNNMILCQKIINKNLIEFTFCDNAEFDDISFNHIKKPQKFVFYYPRLFLDDSNMAWASPIWIIENNNP